MAEPETDVEIIDESEPSAELPEEFPDKVISGIMGLTGFVTACAVGIVVGNPGITILWRAIIAMIVCAMIGRVLGAIGEVAVREFITQYKAQRPIPQMPEVLQRLYRKEPDPDVSGALSNQSAKN